MNILEICNKLAPISLKLCLEQAISIHEQKEDGSNALNVLTSHLSLLNNPESLQMIQLLLDANIDVNNVNEHGFTPLINVIDGEDEKALDLLIAYGADVNFCSDSANHPLNFAINSVSSLSIAKKLILAGANYKSNHINVEYADEDLLEQLTQFIHSFEEKQQLEASLELNIIKHKQKI